MKLKYILSSAVLALGLVSCSNEAEDASNVLVPLKVQTEIQSTRAGINATQFDDKDQIGLFLMKDGKWSSDCFNMSAVTPDGGKSWTMSHQVMLDKTPSLICAYYPWSEDVSTTYGISLNIDIASQTNYLYGITEGVYNEKPVASILFRHALAKVNFLISGDEGIDVSKVSISGEKLMTSGKFNVTTMSFSSTSTGTIVSKNVVQVSATQSNATFLVAPMTEQQLQLKVEYAGGKVYEGTFMVSNISMGKNINYTVKISKDSSMTISETSIEEWGEAETLPEVVLGDETINANGHEYVDLGLPSGTLWATCNVGASTPEEYGDYFAWGETKPKDTYTEANYTYSANTEILPLEFDAAYANWGEGWRMPTYEELEELRIECEWTPIFINGTKGNKVTSKKNGNYIFMPFAGLFGAKSANEGMMGFYWSSQLYFEQNSWYIGLYDYPPYIEPQGRYFGLSVRPVYCK